MKKTSIIFLFVLLLSCFYNEVNAKNLPEKVLTTSKNAQIQKNEILTLEQCINIALNNNPNIGLAINTTKVYESKIGQTKSDYYPQLNMATGYSRNNPSTNSLIDPTTNQYSGNASLNQLIYDFGKTSTKTKIQKLYLSSSSFDVDDATIQIVYNVKQAYYSALLAKINKDIYAQTIKQYEQHLKQAKAFFETGTKSKIDVTTAEVNLSNSKLNFISANNAYKIAKATLNNTMGLNEPPEYDVADTVTFKRPENFIKQNINISNKTEPHIQSASNTVLKTAVEKHNIIESLDFKKFDVKLDEAVKKAFDNRPDLKSLITRETASKESVKLAKKDYFPSLSGFASYGYGGQEFPIDSGWSFGANINVPVFNGLLTKHKVNEARANLNVAKSNIEILKQNIYLQVKQAYINLTEAESRIPVAELIIKQAKENCELAIGRYKVGVGNSVELQDAQVSYNNAQLSYVKALYDYNTAHSALEKAMGVK